MEGEFPLRTQTMRGVRRGAWIRIEVSTCWKLTVGSVEETRTGVVAGDTCASAVFFFMVAATVARWVGLQAVAHYRSRLSFIPLNTEFLPRHFNVNMGTKVEALEWCPVKGNDVNVAVYTRQYRSREFVYCCVLAPSYWMGGAFRF